MTSVGYHSGYGVPVTMEENLREVRLAVERLRLSVPGFQGAKYSEFFLEQIESGLIVLPIKAERWSVMLRWTRLFSGGYLAALKCVAGVLGRQQSFDGSVLEKMDDRVQIQLARKTGEILVAATAKQNECDILIVPVQLGLNYQGQSLEDVHSKLGDDEAGIDLLNLLVQLLNYPLRLKSHEDLWMDCGGTRLMPDWSRSAPFLRVQKTQLELKLGDPADDSGGSGVATFFSCWQ